MDLTDPKYSLFGTIWSVYLFSQNGFMSSLPYVVQFMTTVSGGQLADFIRRKGIMSTTVTRKTFLAISECVDLRF